MFSQTKFNQFVYFQLKVQLVSLSRFSSTFNIWRVLRMDKSDLENVCSDFTPLAYKVNSSLFVFRLLHPISTWATSTFYFLLKHHNECLTFPFLDFDPCAKHSHRSKFGLYHLHWVPVWNVRNIHKQIHTFRVSYSSITFLSSCTLYFPCFIV